MNNLALCAGLVVFTLDFYHFARAYRRRNIFGLIYWGVLLVVMTITLALLRVMSS